MQPVISLCLVDAKMNGYILVYLLNGVCTPCWPTGWVCLRLIVSKLVLSEACVSKFNWLQKWSSLLRSVGKETSKWSLFVHCNCHPLCVIIEEFWVAFVCTIQSQLLNRVKTWKIFNFGVLKIIKLSLGNNLKFWCTPSGIFSILEIFDFGCNKACFNT